MTEVYDNYFKWYKSEYFDIINIESLKKKAVKNKLGWLISACEQFNIRHSSLWRFESLGSLLYLVPVRKTDYICTAFSAIRIIDGTPHSFIYSVMYSHIEFSENGYEIVFDYQSVDPTYKSADGEYRSSFIPHEQLMQIREFMIEHMNLIEVNTCNDINAKNIFLNHISFYPNKIKTRSDFAEIKKEFTDKLDVNRISIKIYSYVFLRHYLVRNLLSMNTSGSHIVDNFIPVLLTNIPDKLNEYLSSINNEPAKTFSYIQISRFINIIPYKSQKFLPLRCGHKIIPLTIFDIESVKDIRLDPWREVYILGKAGNLILNGICQGFPFIGDWFLLQNIDERLFDNKVNHIKFNHSKTAQEIVKNLEIVRGNTYFINPTTKQEAYLSYNMQGLSDSIEIPINYAEQEIIMSGYALCILQEDLGTTVASIPETLCNIDQYKFNIGPIYKNYGVFCKYLFDQLYSLHCLNTRLGVVHGDLHLNNTTYFKDGVPIAKAKEVASISVYEVDGNCFAFPHHGSSAAIIDFSRSFIWNKKILSVDYNKKQIAQIKTDIKLRLIHILERELPDFIGPRKSDIEFLLKRNFETVYDIFKAIDCYKLMNGYNMLINEVILNLSDREKIIGDGKVLNDRILPLVYKIKDAAHNFITTYIDKMIHADNIREFHVPQFNKSIMTSMFSEFMVENYKVPADTVVGNYFNDSNEMRYSMEKYDTLPPLIKLEYSIEHNIESDAPKISKFKIQKSYLSKHNPSEEITEIINEIRQQKSERRGSVKVPVLDKKINAEDSELYFET